MPRYEDGSYSTTASKALIAKVLAGRCQMEYTRAAVGKGSIPEGMTPGTMTEPADYVMDAKIAAVSNPVDGECLVLLQLKSSDVARGFDCTSVILYAKDPDLGDVPFTCVVLETDPERIRPASSAVGKIFDVEVISAVDEVDSVKGAIDPDIMATMGQVQQLIDAHNNDPEAHPNLQRGSGASAVSALTIPAAGWETGGPAGWPYQQSVICNEAEPEKVPCVILDWTSMKAAGAAGLCPTVQSLDGALHFLAKQLPDADLTGSLILYESGSKVAQVPIMIPTDGWIRNGDTETVGSEYTLCTDLPIICVTEEIAPTLTILPGSLDAARICGLCPTCRTLDRTLRIYAKTAPSSEIEACLTLLKLNIERS